MTVHPPKTTPHTLALAGNPNAGKTTIFNAFTGSHQHVGNWPGKTVECKEGHLQHQGMTFRVVDLPGTYSLTAHSPEETIARDFILYEKPDVTVAVIDASNLERNLYLAIQLLELHANLVIALNMTDVAEAHGLAIDYDQLSTLLGGVPVIPTVAVRGKGLHPLRCSILQATNTGHLRPNVRIDYGADVEAALANLERAIQGQTALRQQYNPRWLAIKLLEGEPNLTQVVASLPQGKEILNLANQALEDFKQSYPNGLDLAFANRRYQFIEQIANAVVCRPDDNLPTRSDRVDNVVTNVWVGIPLFLILMYLVFGMVANVSTPYLDWINNVVSGPITSWAAAFLYAFKAPLWLSSLALEGIIPGVGGVLLFIPGLTVLFLFIGILEDSGYLARVAFLMDRAARFIGLRGKSIVPLVLGFGCGVPAIYATRTLEHWRDRLLTALLVPLMSCSARLPVYVIFALAFFPKRADLLIWSLYALGILVATGVGLLFSRFLLKSDQPTAFVLELPPYRVPSIRNLWISVTVRIGDFIRHAGTVILAVSMVVWLLVHLPWGVDHLRQSYFGQLSSQLAPIFKPAGFDQWEASGALITGFVAKEMVISTMSQIYTQPPEASIAPTPVHLGQDMIGIGKGFLTATIEAGKQLVEIFTPGIKVFPDAEEELDDPALINALRQSFNPASALAFVVFVLLYVPCVATLAALRSEFGIRWAAFSIVYQIGLAWIFSTIAYHLATWIGLG